jgi:hypothetical protein
MALLTILGTIAGPVIGIFQSKKQREAAAAAARNPSNIRAAAEAQNTKILSGIAVLVIILIIALVVKNLKK